MLWIFKKLDEIQLKNDLDDNNWSSDKFIFFERLYFERFFYQHQDLRHVLWFLNNVSVDLS